MIPPVESLALMLLRSNTSTLSSDIERELFEPINGLLIQAERVAKGFAKARGRRYDAQFVDECTAEAFYVVVKMLIISFESIKVKFPDKEERDKFFRMSIGYRLKGYVAYRATSTLSYLKKKGIEVQHVPIEDARIYSHDHDLEQHILLESMTRNEFERRMLEFQAMGNSRDLIAQKLGVSRKKVKVTLARLRKRLRKRDPICRPSSHIQIFDNPRKA